MVTESVTIRVVFDTNVVLSALLLSKGQLAWLRSAWAKQILTPLVSKETTEELLRVLECPRFKLLREQRTELIAEYLPVAEVFVVNKSQSDAAQLCRDKHDQIFFALAYGAKVDFLVSGDKDLLELKDLVKFTITTSAQLKQYIEKIQEQ